MKRDAILSAVVAVAIHAFILAGPMPTGGRPYGDVRKPVSLSIIRAKHVATESPPQRATPSPSTKPPHPSRPEVIQEETPPPKKKEVHERPLVTKSPVKERKVNVERIKDHTKETLVTPEPVEHSPEDSIESVNKDAIEEGTHRVDGKVETPSTLETASIEQYDGHDGLKKGDVAPGKGLGEGFLTYSKPNYKEGSRPVYPTVAKRRGYEGTVLVVVDILEAGKLGEVKIVESSGFKVLDKEAVRWVNSDPFVHGPKNGKRTYLVPVTFTFHEKREKALAREEGK